MSVIRRLLLVLLVGVAVFALATPARAQEFNCVVNVDKRQLTGTEYNYLTELQRLVEEYINQRSWTEHTYQEEERIDCTIQIAIESAVTQTRFNARLVLATRRPIYGTTQNTSVLQISDTDWVFNYAQGTPLTFNLERYDELTSVLDFYAYIMLGYDYDTFSDQGGTVYFESARRIAERARALNAPGWSDIGMEQGRYQLISQLLDPRFKRLRTAYFDYHFNGLDRFVRTSDAARGNIMRVLGELSQLRDEVSRSYAEDIFFSAKHQELTAVFADSPLSSQAYQVLSRVDPAHLSVYNSLTQ